ncbi:hypothetical protein EMIHUDRAFT_440339 [Emiliania huxleyi CCMP1516]|uniref:Uncharacterized protein n=2 Tax=Emiliania huxleyi TaxID=2903 RepID=A0A0D3IXQ2_EMIH1|nr:hypothetical protein EMIHUDRAFT_436686 [Emiliania huxleyi CCMP1516]XP_005790129.1 hypothetical protein EMIHUDRAFT_440339 [Emiliania huxleyi CCMP1516]EOD16037.1 hypothetical protein EMIHUDRAFT_436686 [Emiliania huxleyi CCMP1516]EOD37700.1 hypothetical protein EMIHUDRAFT_440339 [Emiliania huxleyi CCMP1516]|eukprot:XP_005768466.1 hypothetical protein EMIHUDRAFT_436686 [Emiliania huxleyi CCMP1516]
MLEKQMRECDAAAEAARQAARQAAEAAAEAAAAEAVAAEAAAEAAAAEAAAEVAAAEAAMAELRRERAALDSATLPQKVDAICIALEIPREGATSTIGGAVAKANAMAGLEDVGGLLRQVERLLDTLIGA